MYCGRVFSTLLVAALIPASAFGQLRKDTDVNMARALTQPKIAGILGLFGLHPEKFSMTHSYSLSFVSFGGKVFNQGLYLNTMRYQLTDPLSVHLQLGIAHHPLGGQLQGTSPRSEIFISRAGFEYAPTKNLKLQLEYSQQPDSYYYQLSPFLDPISRNRSWYDGKGPSKGQEKKGIKSTE